MSRAITRTVILVQAAASSSTRRAAASAGHEEAAEADRFLGRRFATRAYFGCAHGVALWPPPP